MTLARTCLLLLMAGGSLLPSGCGGSSLDRFDEKAGEAGVGATGGSAAGSGGSGGTGGDSVGGTSDGGGSGGSGATGGGGGTGGGAGGARGGGGGTGGSAAGAGGSAAGAGGSVAGAGGSVAGSAGCGVCPFIACAPSISLNVTAPADIVDLYGEVTNVTTGMSIGPLQCYPSGSTGSCGWNCWLYQLGLPSGDYEINLSAPSYLDKTVSFSIEAPTNCGCCGCGCGSGYSGTTELVSNAAAPPACCAARERDPLNCGTCGNACAAAESCVNGECGAI